MRALEDVTKDKRIISIKDIAIAETKGIVCVIRLSSGKKFHVLAGWNEDNKEHVSVSLANQSRFNRGELPTWDDMCQVKDIFFDEEEEAFQIHPPRSCYCDMGAILHLWRATDGGEIHAEGYSKKESEALL